MTNLDTPDVLIVGSGPSGMAAAIELAKDPNKTIQLVDRDDELGGLPRFCDHLGFGLEYTKRLQSGPVFVRYMLNKIKQYPNITVLARTTVTKIALGPTVSLISAELGMINCQPKAVLLATGVREATRAARTICGHRPQNGLINTGQLQQMNTRNVNNLQGRSAVILGTELVSFSALLSARKAGINIVGFIEKETRIQTFKLIKPIVEKILRTPIYTQSEVKFITGNSEQITAIEITRHKQTQSIPCDLVLMTGDWQADSFLAELSNVGVDIATRAISTDQYSRTNIPGVFATGNVTHPVATSGFCANEGKITGRIINNFLDNALPPQELVMSIKAAKNVLLTTPQQLHIANGIAELPDFFDVRTSKSFDKARIIISQGDNVLSHYDVNNIMAYTRKKVPMSPIKHGLDLSQDLTITLEPR